LTEVKFLSFPLSLIVAERSIEFPALFARAIQHENGGGGAVEEELHSMDYKGSRDGKGI